MSIRAYKPTELLSPFIRTYLIIESEKKLINTVLPDTSLVMAFRYKGKLHSSKNEIKNELPSSSISGLRKSVRLYNYSKNTGNILIIFKETGLTSFFKEPLHELFEESISLENFIGHQKFSDLEEQLAEASTNEQRIDFIENFLLSRLYKFQPESLITAALQKINATKGRLKIKHLANSLSVSQDVFEKRFRRTVGTSPKQFSYIVRMRSVIDMEQRKQTLTDLAFDAGYFDQAHFNKDFKLFTGQTPGNFFKSPPFLQINDFLQ